MVLITIEIDEKKYKEIANVIYITIEERYFSEYSQGKEKPVKIGSFTNFLKDRMSSSCTSNSDDIRLLYFINTNDVEVDESFIHTHFRKFHFRKEFFTLNNLQIENLKGFYNIHKCKVPFMIPRDDDSKGLLSDTDYRKRYMLLKENLMDETLLKGMSKLSITNNIREFFDDKINNKIVSNFNDLLKAKDINTKEYEILRKEYPSIPYLSEFERAYLRKFYSHIGEITEKWLNKYANMDAMKYNMGRLALNDINEISGLSILQRRVLNDLKIVFGMDILTEQETMDPLGYKKSDKTVHKSVIEDAFIGDYFSYLLPEYKKYKKTSITQLNPHTFRIIINTLFSDLGYRLEATEDIYYMIDKIHHLQQNFGSFDKEPFDNNQNS